MKKGFLLQFIMLLIAFVGGAVSTYAQKTTTYKFTSKSWNADNGNWTSGKDGTQLNASQGVQITTGTSGANATSPISFENVSKVVVTYSTNSKNGAGSVAIQVGSNTTQSKDVTKEGGTTDRTLEYTYTDSESGNVKITVTCTTNSVYIKSVDITASNGVASLEDPKIAYPVSEFTYDYDNATGVSFPELTINSEYDGEITYKSSNTTVATVDENGNVTPGENGTAKITASWPATEIYSSGSVSYSLTVMNKPTASFEIEDGVFDFTKTEDYGSGAELITDGSDYAEASTTWTAINVEMVVDGKYRWWSGTNNTMRLYAADDTHSAGSISFSVPEGKVITSVDFGQTASSLSASVGEINAKVWTGVSQSVTFTYSASKGSINISKITVTYGDVPTVSVSVGETGFATLASDIALDFTNSEIKAYKASVSGENITLTKVDKVAAGEGVLVYYADGAKTEDIPAATETVEASADNAFVGALEEIASLPTEGESGKNYILSIVNGKVGFYQAAGKKVAAGKAYLSVPATGAKEFYMVNMENAVVTGINEVNTEKADNAIYNLNGVRVKDMSQKGVYIVNGKKVVKK